MLFSIRGVYTNHIIVKSGLFEHERYINQDGRELMNLLHSAHESVNMKLHTTIFYELVHMIP